MNTSSKNKISSATAHRNKLHFTCKNREKYWRSISALFGEALSEFHSLCHKVLTNDTLYLLNQLSIAVFY